MQLVHLYSRATNQYSYQPAKSVALWQRHGWEVVNPEPEADEASEAETDGTAESSSRGTPTARSRKDK